MAEELVKTSIFYQTTYKKRYTLRIKLFRGFGYDDSCEYLTPESMADAENLIDNEKEIFRCNIAMPLLKVGDKFFIEELSKFVRIREAYRTSKDNVCYKVEDEYIEDTETIDTYNKAIVDLINYCKDDKNKKDYDKYMTAKYKRKYEYNKNINYRDLGLWGRETKMEYLNPIE